MRGLKYTGPGTSFLVKLLWPYEAIDFYGVFKYGMRKIIYLFEFRIYQDARDKISTPRIRVRLQDTQRAVDTIFYVSDYAGLQAS